MGAVLVSTLFDTFGIQPIQLKTAFIINGSKHLTDTARKAIDLCKTDQRLEVHLLKTEKAKDAIQLAHRCVEEKFDVVIAVGGDGTVNEVLNGIMLSENFRPILGVLPNGTGNDFVRGTDLDLCVDELPVAILSSRTVDLDVAKVSTVMGVSYFINIADIGFGGKVVQVLDKQRRFIGGKASYAIAILRAFMGYRRPELEITADAFKYKGSVLMVAICNGSIFGDGLTINPYARMDDGKLNITLLGKVTLLDYVKNLKNLKSGRQINHTEAKYLETTEISITIIDGNAVGEMDGEYFSQGTCKINVLPRCIHLLKY